MQATPSFWWVPLLSSLLGAIFGAIFGTLSNLLLQSKTRRDQWRNYSKLGISIIDSLLEEINNGLKILEGQQGGALIPTASWDGMDTIPNEVLLRIVAMSERQRSPESSFPVSSIRIHCKNYFTHISKQFNNAIKQGAKFDFDQTVWMLGTTVVQFASFLEGTRKVVRMLNDARSLLEENSRRRFPK